MIDVYTVDPYILNCVFTEVIKQVNVSWIISTEVENFGFISIEQGAYEDHSQTSTMTLTSSQLIKLKSAGESDKTHVFTCKITVGDTPTEYTTTQKAKIYTPGNNLLVE